MSYRETPYKGDLYFYLNENDEERIATWQNTPEDYERERRGVVFNQRKQLKDYLAGKLCSGCEGYGLVTAWANDGEGHSYPDGTEPCGLCNSIKR